MPRHARQEKVPPLVKFDFTPPSSIRTFLLAACPLALLLALSSESVTASQGSGPLKIGVLVMAHGGDAAWNRTVLDAVGLLQEQLPVAVALGMAERTSLQAAVTELETAGVQRAVVVRLFISGASFRAQTEYLLDLSDDAPSFFMGHEGPEPPERLARTLDVTISEAGLVDSPLVGQILSERVAALSIEPARETVLILAHGMGQESDNDALLRAMESRAETVRAAAPYQRVIVETLREDWQDPREQAEARIRALLLEVARAGDCVIVVPLRVSGFGDYAEVLEGLEYAADGRGLLPHPLMSEWIRQTVEQAVSRAGWGAAPHLPPASWVARRSASTAVAAFSGVRGASSPSPRMTIAVSLSAGSAAGPVPCHSLRRASSGSTRVARRAGIHEANAATSVSNRPTPRGANGEPVLAPMAMRTPISWVRCDTAWAATP